MNRATLMRQVFKCFLEIFLQCEDPIGNKAFWHISDMFQVRYHFPIPEFLFAAFLELEVQRSPQAAIPGHEKHEELSLNTNMFAIQEADAVAEREKAFCPREQSIPSFERPPNSSNRCRM